MLSASIALTLSVLISAPEKADLPKLFQRVRGCVFEVVIHKRIDTGAAYMERLPVENLSYQERHDSVWSIGSAFAVGRDTVLTAAHVMELGVDDTILEPMLRDINGRIFKIGQILKYSSHQDFALFTVPGLSVKQPLRPAKAVDVGQTVLAVGNALGEGIVLRDGLLTSQTPENQNGEWKYWRFSAAASPGNSGGPLIDGQGGLVGVVLMKSESENLNYALPWSEVASFPLSKGRFRDRSGYVHPSLPDKELVTVMDTTFDLPRAWRQLDHLLWGLAKAKVESARDSLLREEAANYFPRGKSARQKMFPIMQNLPTTLVRGSDGWWILNVRKSGEPVDLGDHGSWVASSDDGFVRARLDLPDSSNLTDFVDDSRRLGDLLLKGGRLDRKFADKDIRVASLGKAVVDSIRVDKWGRPWLVRVWKQPWNGESLVAHLLPKPYGFGVIVYVLRDSYTRSFGGRRMEDIADASFDLWSGTGQQWKRWCARPELVPTFMKSLRFDAEAKEPEVVWDDAKFRLVPSVAEGSAKTQLVVYPMFKDVGKDSSVLCVGGVALTSDAATSRFAMAMRIGPPVPEMPPEVQLQWKNRLEDRAPYDGSPIDKGEGKKMATKVVSSNRAAADSTRSMCLWTVTVALDGAPTRTQTDRALDATMAKAVLPRETPVASLPKR